MELVAKKYRDIISQPSNAICFCTSVSNTRCPRLAMGLSQKQLAARLQLAGLGLTQKAVSRIETGDRVVPDYELIVFSEVLKVPICTLLLCEQATN